MDNSELQPIHWFPGHMHKARKALQARAGVVDVYIELLDARIPMSSSNPLLAEYMGSKPRLRILSKTDLADPEKTRVWMEYFTGQGDVPMLLDSRKKGAAGPIPEMCRKLYPADRSPPRLITAMVVGIPNVGKSTLINSLAGRSVARTGDQPALTRDQQFIEIDAGFRLLDTPGIMWPKVENVDSGYRLAITGAIRDTAVSHTDVAVYALTELSELYPQRLVERYGESMESLSGIDSLIQVGRRRGCLVKGGEVDLDRAAKIVIADIRGGRLGRITWELPNPEKAQTINDIVHSQV